MKKKPRGRPPVEKKRDKHKLINFRAEELERLKAEAAVLDLDVNSYIRLKCLKQEKVLE